MSEAANNDDAGKSEPRQRGKERTYWVAIMCPSARLPVPVGITSDKSSFESSSFQKNSFSCSACGRMHTWDRPAAFPVVPRGNYVGERFENEVLILDSSSFDRCVIQHCNIHLSRGNFRLTNCEISGSRFNFTGEAAAVKVIADSLRVNRGRERVWEESPQRPRRRQDRLCSFSIDYAHIRHRSDPRCTHLRRHLE